MRFKLNNKGYQILGMPFGWAMSPWWANKLTKPIQSWLNNKKIKFCWWVDDILLLGKTKQEAEEGATHLITLLNSLGVRVNPEKSTSQAEKIVNYL